MKDRHWTNIMLQLENILNEAEKHRDNEWVIQNIAEEVMSVWTKTAWNKTDNEAKEIAHDLVCLNPDLREKTIIG